jgi:hypothetical protein
VILSPHSSGSTQLRHRDENSVSVNPLERALPNTRGSKILRIPSCAESPSNPFRINTYKSVTKQTTLTISRINTYEKHRGVGVLLLTRNVRKDFHLERAPRPRNLSSLPARGVRPERPSAVKDLSCYPMRIAVPEELRDDPRFRLGRKGLVFHSSLATRHSPLTPGPRFASLPYGFLLNYIVPNLHSVGPTGQVPYSAQSPRSQA